ncbi:sorting nexin-7-like protein [Lates japonicus]|uniref:Sorting nexin-7-like protein n=1 Tax=Lates japonicus TaxID=270547 RepID=A0AAD3NL06_LATJO|nr:sorting nexin-7-like protein [Lates japonicus]
MSGQTVPADFSGHMLDLDEDEDLEVFSKERSDRPWWTSWPQTVTQRRKETKCPGSADELTLGPDCPICFLL